MKKQEKKKIFHACDFPGCSEPGEYRAPRDRSLRSYYWFCFKHVQAYNQKWDFLAGLSADQIEAQLQNDVVWQRPTWKLGTGGSAKVVHGRVQDKFHFFDEAQLGMSGKYNPPQHESRYSRKVQDAMLKFWESKGIKGMVKSESGFKRVKRNLRKYIITNRTMENKLNLCSHCQDWKSCFRYNLKLDETYHDKLESYKNGLV